MPTCPTCNERPARSGQRTCTGCHAAYMREWRKTHPLNAEQRRKDNARSHANIAKRRGQLVAQPCEVCGATDVVMHHEDYDRPLDVIWLCVEHHHARHHPAQGVRP